jgi:ABC-2 type transport system permease protein
MNRRLIGLVAARELLVRLKDRVFWISTGFLLLIVAASVLLPALFFGDERPTMTVAVVGNQARVVAEGAARLAQAAPDDDPTAATITVVSAGDVADAEGQVGAGAVEAALITTGTGLEVVAEREVDPVLGAALGASAQDQLTRSALGSAGMSAADIDRFYAGVASAAPHERLLDPPAGDQDVAIGLSYLFALLFFFTTFAFGMYIAQSVVEEKQNRVVELLVAVVPVRSLLAGKVLGNLALAVGQVVALLAVGFVGAAVAGQGDVVRLLSGSSGWFFLFFLLGFGMISCLWAAAGSIASRQEELQSTTVPLQALLFVPFFAAIYVTTPGTALTVLSYVPFTAPLSMPRRLMLDDAALWEPLLAAGLMLLTALALVLVASRLYERSLLRTHSRTSWREAWSGTPTR